MLEIVSTAIILFLNSLILWEKIIIKLRSTFFSGDTVDFEKKKKLVEL